MWSFNFLHHQPHPPNSPNPPWHTRPTVLQKQGRDDHLPAVIQVPLVPAQYHLLLPAVLILVKVLDPSVIFYVFFVAPQSPQKQRPQKQRRHQYCCPLDRPPRHRPPRHRPQVKAANRPHAAVSPIRLHSKVLLQFFAPPRKQPRLRTTPMIQFNKYLYQPRSTKMHWEIFKSNSKPRRTQGQHWSIWHRSWWHWCFHGLQAAAATHWMHCQNRRLIWSGTYTSMLLCWPSKQRKGKGKGWRWYGGGCRWWRKATSLVWRVALLKAYKILNFFYYI